MGQQGIDLRDHVAHSQPGIDHTAVQPLPEPQHGVVQHGRKRPVEPQVAAIIGLALKRDRPAAGQQGRKLHVQPAEVFQRADGRERDQVRPQPVLFLALGGQECVIGNLPFGAQCGAVDPGEGRKRQLARLARRAQLRVGEDLRQFITADLPAVKQRAERVDRHRPAAVIAHDRQ